MGYDHLVVAAGLQINWGKIKGLPETIGACVRRCVHTHAVCRVADGGIVNQSSTPWLSKNLPAGPPMCYTGKNGVVSVYDYEYAQDTWTALQGIKARV